MVERNRCRAYGGEKQMSRNISNIIIVVHNYIGDNR